MPSLTHQERYPVEARWPSVLAKALGPSWTVLAEGHPGRTSVHEDPIEGVHKSGARTLPALLESHRPLDLVIIMLGTNDLKARFGVSALEISQGVERLVDLARGSASGPGRSAPDVLVITPTPVLEVGPLAPIFRGGEAKSNELAAAFEAMGVRADVPVFDAGKVCSVSPVDGIHFDASALERLGLAVADHVTQMTQHT